MNCDFLQTIIAPGETLMIYRQRHSGHFSCSCGMADPAQRSKSRRSVATSMNDLENALLALRPNSKPGTQTLKI